MTSVRALTFDDGFVKYLTSLGIENAPTGTFAVHDMTAIEPPASIYGIDIWAFPALIGCFTYFGPGQFLNAEIGRYCSVGSDLQVGLSRHPTNHLTTSPVTYMHFGRFQSYIEASDASFKRSLPEPFAFDYRPRTHIGNDVWIGARVYIKDGIRIGDGAIIGAQSVVTRDVPPYHIVAGNPARTLRLRFSEKVLERLMALQWWQYNIYDFDGIDTRDIESALDKIEALSQDKKLIPYVPQPVNLTQAHNDYLLQKAHEEEENSNSVT